MPDNKQTENLWKKKASSPTTPGLPRLKWSILNSETSHMQLHAVIRRGQERARTGLGLGQDRSTATHSLVGSEVGRHCRPEMILF